MFKRTFKYGASLKKSMHAARRKPVHAVLAFRRNYGSENTPAWRAV
jgi:hypothetical protein